MYAYSYPPVMEQKVVLNGHFVKTDRIWAILKANHPVCMHDEHYIIVSNTKRALMAVSGHRNGKVFYINNMIPLCDQPFYQWKNFMRTLEINHFELVLSPDAHTDAGIARGYGLSHISKRVKFTPFDISRFCARAPMIHELENCSLEDVEQVGLITKISHPHGYKDVLTDVAYGITSAVIRKQNEQVTGAMYIRDYGKEVSAADYVSIYNPQDPGYSKDFSEFFRYMLARCGADKKSLVISLAANAKIPTYDGINHEVITHNYTLA